MPYFLNRRAGASAAAVLLALLLSQFPAHAWGPHETITQAALDALGTNDPMVSYLGAQTQRLTNYAWMGDYFGVVVEDPEELFYADDYLLFPQAQSYFDHTGPGVKGAFRPFFARAVQALRTENPVNAARWMGALLHFVEDSVCPPHAAGLRGDVHTKMENWVEPERIRLPDFQVQSLGATEAEVLPALLRRLDEMIPQAQERGRRLRVQVMIGNQSAVRAPMLESALDCARLTADLLHAMGGLRTSPGTGTAILRGKVTSLPPVGMERFPAKIMLQDTTFSTLADLEGRFEFRNLPARNFTILAFRPGYGPTSATMNLKAAETNLCELTLSPSPFNLIPNGDFKLSWVRPGQPDYWYQTKSGWEGEPILLQDGQRYRLRVEFKPGAKSQIVVRTLKRFEHALPRFKIEPRFQSHTLSVDEPEMTLVGGQGVGFLHLTIRGRSAPASVCERISLVPVKAGE